MCLCPASLYIYLYLHVCILFTIVYADTPSISLSRARSPSAYIVCMDSRAREHTHTHTQTHTHTHFLSRSLARSLSLSLTHTHTQTYNHTHFLSLSLSLSRAPLNPHSLPPSLSLSQQQSIYDLAEQYGVSWLSVWSLNLAMMRPDSGLLPGHYLNYMSAKTKKSDLEEENTCAQTAASFRATKCITYTPNCVLFFKMRNS